MTRYQIATNTYGNHTVTIFVEAASDPALDITLHLRDIGLIRGLNMRRIPIGHLPTEYEIPVIDFNNELYLALKDVAEKDAILQVDYSGSTEFEGNIKLGAQGYHYHQPTNILVLNAHDGIVNLRSPAAGEAHDYYCQKKPIGTLLEELLHATGHALPVKICTELFHSGATGSGTDRVQQHRISVDALTRGITGATLYQVLINLCEDFELTVFQEDGAWYVLGNYERAGAVTEVYNMATASKEVVDFSTSLPDADLRQKQSARPKLLELPDPGIIKTVNDVVDDHTKIQNPDFDEWDPAETYPIGWCYDDPARYDKSNSISDPRLKALSSGRLVYQMIPMSNAFLEAVKIKIKARLTFAADSDSGSCVVRLARIRAFNESGHYGYDQVNNDWDASGDGWITIRHNYPNASQQTETLDLDVETAVLGGKRTLLLELWYEIDRTAPDSQGGVIDKPEFFNASVELIETSGITKQVAYLGAGEGMERNAYLSDRRPYRGISDLEYNNGTNWIETTDGWGTGLYRSAELTRRRALIWNKPVRVIDSPVGSDRRLKMYEEVSIVVNGETINCIPLQIRTSKSNKEMNSVRLIECQKLASVNNPRVEYEQ